ncbi:MAG: alginate export family protein [Bacteroidales bacterium]|nr:alginate export family protein [Bacteroidales bacterium]
MIKHFHYYSITAILFMMALPSQAQFSISGEFRTRAEARNGYRNLSSEDKNTAYLISQRSRAQLYYQKDWLKTGLSFQDVRLWGDETVFNSTGVFGDNGSVELNEAWVQFMFRKHANLKIGRQYFEYDDSRLLSIRNWSNNTLSYDACLFQYEVSEVSFDLGISYNNQTDNLFGNPYIASKMKTLNFARAAYAVNKQFTASVITVSSGFHKNDSSEVLYLRQSLGTYLTYSNDHLNTWGSFYYQFGRNVKGIKVSAWNFNYRADYRFEKLSLGAGFTALSGDDQSNQSSDNLFDLLYGTRHKFLGYMDYFNNVPKSTANGGLNDVFAVVDYAVTPRLHLTAEYHNFSLNRQVPDATTAPVTDFLKSQLGNEVDLWFNLKFNKVVGLSGGYSFMLPGESLEKLQNIPVGESKFSSWAWLQLTVKPEFFNSGDAK